ncbi:transposase [Streptomyces mirabilis]|uniref:transposase n=1 Tax=Streptomyces mirabilis TaxID=68239 RepID=UPI00365FAC5C
MPDERDFTTKNDLARAMVLRALASPLLVSWVTADSAYGQDSRFRRFLEDVGLSYVVAVPKSQQVHGPRIEDRILPEAPAEAWQHLSAGPGAKGERYYDWAAARLPAVWEFDGDEPTRQRWMLGRRSIAKPDEIVYYLASAPLDTTVAGDVATKHAPDAVTTCGAATRSRDGPPRPSRTQPHYTPHTQAVDQR